MDEHQVMAGLRCLRAKPEFRCEGGWPQEGETAHERIRLAVFASAASLGRFIRFPCLDLTVTTLASKAWLVRNARKSSLRQLSLGRAMALVNLLLSSQSPRLQTITEPSKPNWRPAVRDLKATVSLESVKVAWSPTTCRRPVADRSSNIANWAEEQDFEKQENSRCNLPTSLREGEVACPNSSTPASVLCSSRLRIHPRFVFDCGRISSRICGCFWLRMVGR